LNLRADLTWIETAPTADLMRATSERRDQQFGRVMSYSRKVFVPLTRLCRDVCHYCTFATAPRSVASPYLSYDEVLAIARRGEAAGCTEILFTLGDKPELRYSAARKWLDAAGHASTIDYLRAICELVLRDTTLLPHVNPGIMTREEIASLREVSASQGIMLESSSERLCEDGNVHHGSPDKHPAVRLKMIAEAGELAVPFTTGILIGIGETRRERLQSLADIAELHTRYGHIQEVIIQNFRAKDGTRLQGAAEPDFDDLAWTIAAARCILPPDVALQAPPNLSPETYGKLVSAGINDWGGISPVTIDHVNPEAPWPEIIELERHTAAAGKILVNRLPAYPAFAQDPDRWFANDIAVRIRHLSDAEGFARQDAWCPGVEAFPLRGETALGFVDPSIKRAVSRAQAGERLDIGDIVRLFAARGPDYAFVTREADLLRQQRSGDTVRYVVNRNINYTNICYFKCAFCAFSKGKTHEALRGKPYDLTLAEIVRRSREAWDRGATEVCLQGGIHPDYDGNTYLGIVRAIKAALPQMHIHAFSPLEITQGAATLGIDVETFLAMLRDEGLGTLPGTAAEILDDGIRAVLCPDKLKTGEWLATIEAAHRLGLRTTATIMFGHMEQPVHWARHLLAIRDLQERTGGFTEFVPLPFVHMEAPMYQRGRARKGPTSREAVLMHSVARLVLNPLISNIQTSWVKMGPAGVAASLKAGANDLGGTLMNESISRAAGTQHGQEMPPEAMERLIRSIGRLPEQRSTLYADVDEERRTASFAAAELSPVVLNAPQRLRATSP
jgi:FO synthase